MEPNSTLTIEGRKPFYPKLEQFLVNFLTEQRERKLSVTKKP